MRAYNYFNKIQNSSLMAFIVCSICYAVAELFSLLGYFLGDGKDIILSDFSSLLKSIVPYIFCYFITQYFTNEIRWFKSFWSVLCLLVMKTAFGNDISFFAGIIAALFCSFFFEHFNKMISMTVTILTAAIFGILLRYTADIFNDFQMTLAYTISNKGILSSVLFSAVKALLSLFDNDSFADLFFYKSYGGTSIIDNELITGTKDLFQNGYSGEHIADFLTGHFFLLFALVGITLAFADNLKGNQKICLIITACCAVISGNTSLLVLFIFLESWHFLLSIILISVLSYLSSVLLDIRIGYLFNGGIIELILNINKPLYLIAGGLVFVAIGFFAAKYTILKFGISDSLNIYIPTKLNRLVKSLGGIVNIVKIDNDTIEVRNPKLVNNFEIDCEIRENLVQIDDEKINELKEYLK